MKKLVAIVAIILVIVFVIGFGLPLMIGIGGSIIYINSDVYSARKLVNAIQIEDIDAVRQIVEEDPSSIHTYPAVLPKWCYSLIDVRVTYPLTEACITGNKEIVTFLLEHGADPSCNDGLTPLWATYTLKKKDWYAISLLLIEYGASLDYVTFTSDPYPAILMDIVTYGVGGSSDHYTVESSEKVMAAFQYAFENMNKENVNWMWVLKDSVSCNRLEIVRFLLDEQYCDVNDTSRDMTALMFAARDAKLEMVQLLLDYGADKYIEDSDGKTAYDYAYDYANEEYREAMLELLDIS